MKIEFGETPEKRVTVVQQTTNKSIGNRHSCVASYPLDFPLKSEWKLLFQRENVT